MQNIVALTVRLSLPSRHRKIRTEYVFCLPAQIIILGFFPGGNAYKLVSLEKGNNHKSNYKKRKEKYIDVEIAITT